MDVTGGFDLTQVEDMMRSQSRQVGQGIKPQTPDAGQFLKDFIMKELPKHVVTSGLSLIGRDDGSGMMAHRVLQAGQNPEFMGGIFK